MCRHCMYYMPCGHCNERWYYCHDALTKFASGPHSAADETNTEDVAIPAASDTDYIPESPTSPPPSPPKRSSNGEKSLSAVDQEVAVLDMLDDDTEPETEKIDIIREGGFLSGLGLGLPIRTVDIDNDPHSTPPASFSSNNTFFASSPATSSLLTSPDTPSPSPKRRRRLLTLRDNSQTHDINTLFQGELQPDNIGPEHDPAEPEPETSQPTSLDAPPSPRPSHAQLFFAPPPSHAIPAEYTTATTTTTSSTAACAAPAHLMYEHEHGQVPWWMTCDDPRCDFERVHRRWACCRCGHEPNRERVCARSWLEPCARRRSAAAPPRRAPRGGNEEGEEKQQLQQRERGRGRERGIVVRGIVVHEVRRRTRRVWCAHEVCPECEAVYIPPVPLYDAKIGDWLAEE